MTHHRPKCPKRKAGRFISGFGFYADGVPDAVEVLKCDLAGARHAGNCSSFAFASLSAVGRSMVDASDASVSHRGRQGLTQGATSLRALAQGSV